MDAVCLCSQGLGLVTIAVDRRAIEQVTDLVGLLDAAAVNGYDAPGYSCSAMVASEAPTMTFPAATSEDRPDL